jgi:hypothetical protein
LSLATSMPASIMPVSTSFDLEAGPIVHTIFERVMSGRIA